MPPDLIRPTKGKGSVEAIRTARAQAMAQQRQMQQLEMLTKAGKNLGGAPQGIQDSLTEQMKSAAAELQFEVAARLRDELRELKRELRGMEEAGT